MLYHFRQFCDYGLMATYYGANCVYIVFISQSICDVVNDAIGIDWDVRIYIIFGTIACLLIGQVCRDRECRDIC